MKNNLASVQSESLFLDIFADVFGAHKLSLLFPQYQFTDIYGNTRFADFVINEGNKRVAIEIDGEAVHNRGIVSSDKFDDDHLKQNSMISYGWDVYRWSYRKLLRSADTVKDEMYCFFGDSPKFSSVEDYLPTQQGEVIEGNFELREYQQEALDELSRIRAESKTMALICHATGAGKTVTAVMDAKSVGGRVLFLAHTKDLVVQPAKTFEKLWADKDIGYYVDGKKEKDAFIVCGSIQSVVLNLDEFNPSEFDYIIIDEAHHASSESYQKVIAHFRSKFLLGLTATPERADGQDILELFQSVAHKIDMKTAVETGWLTPVRSIRIKTNIDISNVRFNGVKYNAQDLESKLFVPERNKLIVDTYLKFATKRRTVIFCVSVKHSEEIANLLCENGVKAVAVSGQDSASQRAEVLSQYENGYIDVLCACDLLNEGWDSPKTDTLFMARPTMSKLLYTQQLGRGMRLAEGKESLIVFDFVDNSNMFNSAYTLHKIAGKKEYREGGLVFASQNIMQADEALYAKGERPDALLDFPISAIDYEIVDIFDWQEQVKDMKSQLEFIRMVDVQSETIEKYIREEKIKADFTVDTGSSRKFRYFKEESILKYAKEFNWMIITNDKKKNLFMEYVAQMDMSYSYKPVFLKAFFVTADSKGKAKIEDISNKMLVFYNDRKQKGLKIEKSNSIYTKDEITQKQVIQNILSNPFKRFEDMNMMRHTKTLGVIELDKNIFNKLDENNIQEILKICDDKIGQYYNRI